MFLNKKKHLKHELELDEFQFLQEMWVIFVYIYICIY